MHFTFTIKQMCGVFFLLDLNIDAPLFSINFSFYLTTSYPEVTYMYA